MRHIQCTLALLLPVLAAACGREAIGSAEPIVRDSAGVRIVQNAQAPLGEWHLGTSPLFTVGWGSEDPKFTWVQSGRVLPDGGALIADFGDKSIYRVGPDGSIVATWGREGEGPGEYQGLDAILLRGDSVLVSDRRLMRVTLLSMEGEVLATRPLPGAVLHEVSSVLDDGRLLLIPGNAYSYVTEMRQEWVFERQPIIAATLDGVTVDTLLQLPHLRRWYGSRGAPPGAVPVRGRAGGFTDGFAWSRADQPEVRWYDGMGRLVQIARWDEVPLALTPDWRTRLARNYEQAIRSRNADETFVAARVAEFEEGLDRQDGLLPYWDSFLVDRQGNAWLREYSLPGEPSDRWRVVTREGSLVGWIDVPNVASILDITSDRVLAVRLDELDVSAVVMLQLWRR